MIGEAKEQQKHVTTQREELAGEAKQLHTAMTAAHRGETIDSENQELLALIKKRKNLDRNEKAQVKDISKKIKKGIRENKRSRRHEKVQNILEEFKEMNSIENFKTRKTKSYHAHEKLSQR